MRHLVLILVVLGTMGSSYGGDVTLSVDPESSLQIVSLSQKETHVRVAPQAGANAFSIQIDGIEFLRQPESLTDLPGVGFGNPVLYPTPNRVKNANFTFRGQRFSFQPNAGKNFIHGLVNRAAWKVDGTAADAEAATVTCSIDFERTSQLYRQFPVAHQLRLTITVRDQAVRWTYEVDNQRGDQAVPFGFALHPYFLYQGKRSQTYLTIPATHWMEAESQLPSGRLIPADALNYPLGEPMSLEGTQFDDVFFGLTPESRTIIEFRDVGRRVEISASQEFTHLVVWTPERPYFGVESQTCSTDAHNLDQAGFEKAAHLQVAEPGEAKSGWVEYRFSLR